MVFVFVKSQQIQADMFLPDRSHLAPLLLFTCLRLSFQWTAAPDSSSPRKLSTHSREEGEEAEDRKEGRKERVILLLLLLQEGSGLPHVTEDDAYIKVQQDDVCF